MTFHTKLSLVQNHWVFWFEKRDGFIKIYDRIRYLALFTSERYNAIYNKTK